MKEGQKVMLPDGRVGNVISTHKDEVHVCIPVESPHPVNPGRTVAGLKEEVFEQKKLKTEWTETDVHGRVFDQNGDQVGFDPKAVK